MFLHNKEITHNSTTLTNTYSKSSGRQFQVSKFEIYKKKKKNVSIRSYIIRKQHTTPPPSQIPISRVLGVNSKSPSPKSTKKRKRMLVYIIT